MAYDKETLLGGLKDKIAQVRAAIEAEKSRINEIVPKSMSEAKKMGGESFDKYLYLNQRSSTDDRLAELARLFGSPFFVRCDIVSKRTGRQRSLFFAKHPLIEELIYSWVAPIASIRFESPGEVSYTLPNGQVEHATLLRKEQYMIIDGKPIFFAIETIDSPRELIHQEHFSSRKSGFVLPEIVSVMEKAQDQIIRAHHKGPFVISGPAGSGKTTLALHRVAYLAQSPDSAHLYPESSVIVFVQDNGTKDYFSHLLPELGIHHVHITTFFEWASEILGLTDATFDPHADHFDEWKKLQTLRSGGQIKPEGNTLSRVDITSLLMSFVKKNKKVEIIRERIAYKNGTYRETKRREPVRYSLMVVDEFQNYLPEQLSIMKSCLDEETQSMVFVGDMAQQIYPGTIRTWDQIGENVPTERAVKLHKVYRNTKQILEYLRGIGYAVEIPAGIKEGPPVMEKKSSGAEAVEYVRGLVGRNGGKTIGIICSSDKDVSLIKAAIHDTQSVRISTMLETQGVEFDLTCVIQRKTEEVGVEYPDEFRAEREKTDRDLTYVALTRAMDEMHVISIINPRV